MGKRTPPCPMYPDWTSAKFRQHIKGALREAHKTWPPMRLAKEAARRDISREEQIERGIRHRKEYQCAHCKQWFKEKDGKSFNIQVDHIIPVGGPEGGWDWGPVISRMFVQTERYQVLCRSCHAIKTKEDRQITREQSKETERKGSKPGYNASIVRRKGE